MLVGASGRLEGTVGGGCVEAEVIQAALDAQVVGRPRFIEQHLNADLAGDLGLSCGGTVEVFVEPIVAAPPPAYLAALEAAATAVAGVVTTSVDWSEGPAKTFAPLSATANPGAAALISPDRHFVIERFTLAPRVLVFGAGHVGAAIARAAATAGFRVTVVDDRSEFADPARFPSEVRVRVEDARVALAGFGAGPGDAVVVATRGHRHDATILDQVARLPVGYIGLLGSRRKRAVIIRGLAAAGGPVEALARVRVPVGVAIGAITPEEIAVSVTAELIAWRRNAGVTSRG